MTFAFGGTVAETGDPRESSDESSANKEGDLRSEQKSGISGAEKVVRWRLTKKRALE